MNPDPDPVKTIFVESLNIAPHLRESFWASHPLATPDVIEKVQEMLASLESHPQFLSSSFLERKSAPDPTYSPGQNIGGRYEIVEVLDLTASNEVYRAEDLRLSRNSVVIKFPTGPHPAPPQREINSLARLNIPFVAGLIDFGFHQGVPYLVTRYLPGLRLDRWIQQLQPALSLRLHAFHQVLRIVQSIHEHGLLHLDLKPANIIIDEGASASPVAQIVDFGVAAFNDQSHIAAAGTPRFTAPERVLNQATPASDIYSLARLGEYLLPDAPTAYRETLSRGFATDPAARPRSVAEFAASLHATLRPGWLSRNQSAVIAASLLVTAIATLNWLRSASNPPPPPIDAPLHLISSMRGVESQPCFSPDGTTVYFTHTLERVSAIYSATFDGGIPRLIVAAEPGQGVAECTISPDGKTLAYVISGINDNTPEIHLLDILTRRQQPIYRGTPDSTVFHPTLNYLYFSEQNPEFPLGQLRRIHLDSKAVESLPAPPAGLMGDNDFSISRDGRSLVFVRYTTRESADLFLLPLSPEGLPAAAPVRLTNMAMRIKRPQWHPNGRQIIFSAGPLTNMSMYELSMDQRGSLAAPRLISAWKDRLRYPSIALNVPRIAFTQDREECDIFSYQFANRQLAHMLSSTTLEEEARYSPDGKSIAFLSERSGSLQAFIAPADSRSQPTRISNWVSAEKAWVAWDTAGRAHWYARTPAMGQILLTLSPSSDPITRKLPTASNETVVGLGIDGDSFFLLNRSSSGSQLQRVLLKSGQRFPLSNVDAYFVREFADPVSGESLLLYSHERASEGLFQLVNGQPRQIYPTLSRRSSFAYHNGDVYLVAPTPRQGLYRVRLDSGESTLLEPLDKTPGWGLDVAPDGRSLLLALFDFADSNILGATLP